MFYSMLNFIQNFFVKNLFVPKPFFYLCNINVTKQ